MEKQGSAKYPSLPLDTTALWPEFSRYTHAGMAESLFLLRYLLQYLTGAHVESRERVKGQQ